MASATTWLMIFHRQSADLKKTPDPVTPRDKIASTHFQTTATVRALRGARFQRARECPDVGVRTTVWFRAR